MKRFLMFLLLGGCVSMSATYIPAKVAETFPARTLTEKIELFRAGTPAKKFSEIGLVRACCSNNSNLLVEMLRQKAAESGGDGLMGIEINAEGAGTASVI